MLQPTTECVDSLTIDDVTGQAVPESGTGRTKCSVANSCKPHSRYLQSMWSKNLACTDWVFVKLHFRATGCHLPYVITHCDLPPDTSEHTPP